MDATTTTRRERALSDACLDQSAAWALGVRRVCDGGGEGATMETTTRAIARVVIDASASRARTSHTGFSTTMRAREKSLSEVDTDGWILNSVEEEPTGSETSGRAEREPSTEEEKRERRMQANRLSAAKSRMKKMRRVVELEHACDIKAANVNALRTAVETLKTQLAELKARNAELRLMDSASSMISEGGGMRSSASMDLLTAISDVPTPSAEMRNDEKDFAEVDSPMMTSRLERTESIERVFNSEEFFSSPPPKSSSSMHP